MLLSNGKTYSTNFERASSYFETTLAPQENSIAKQQVHDYLLQIYSAFGSKTSEMGLKVSDDVWFKDWEPQKGREKDVKIIREANKKIFDFIEMLFLFVKNASVCDDGLCINADELKLNKFFFTVLDAANLSYLKENTDSKTKQKSH